MGEWEMFLLLRSYITRPDCRPRLSLVCRRARWRTGSRRAGGSARASHSTGMRRARPPNEGLERRQSRRVGLGRALTSGRAGGRYRLRLVGGPGERNERPLRRRHSLGRRRTCLVALTFVLGSADRLAFEQHYCFTCSAGRPGEQGSAPINQRRRVGRSISGVGQTCTIIGGGKKATRRQY